MIRTCIGCRIRQEPDAEPRLVHVVASGSVITPDPGRSLPGRGAWVHPDCALEATRRRAWGRALRIEGAVDLSLVQGPQALRV